MYFFFEGIDELMELQTASEFPNESDDLSALKQQNRYLQEEIKKLRLEADVAKDNIEQHQAYQESQDRFRTVFEYSRLGNKIISADLKIKQVNSAMVNLLGYSSKDEIIGTRILDYSPAEYHKHWMFLQKKLWQKFTPSFSLETCLQKKDGSVIWCQVTSILFPDLGEFLGYTIIEDITEKRLLRRQREEFISVASHELKTPITSLKAVLQLLNRLLIGQFTLPEKVIDLAKNAQVLTLKMTHLVDELLSSTKIEQGQLSLNKTRFKISEVLESCSSVLSGDEKHFITHVGDISLDVNADQFKIEQVLINLLNNAVKYAPDSAEITIQVEQQENRQVKVSVTDQGQGIAAEALLHLFDRYYRVNKTESRISGLGLGLYISSEIIKRHGGNIGVDSTLGKGSTFWFTLPQD